MYALAGRLQHRAQESDRGAFAVGAADMDHGRQLALRIAERGKQPVQPPKRKIDPFRVKCAESGENFIGGGLRRLVAAQLMPPRVP